MTDARWIEYATPDGVAARIADTQIEIVLKWIESDLGTIHTTRGEIIKVANVSVVLAQMAAAPEVATSGPVAAPNTPVKPARRPRMAALRAAFVRTAARLATS